MVLVSSYSSNLFTYFHPKKKKNTHLFRRLVSRTFQNYYACVYKLRILRRRIIILIAQDLTAYGSTALQQNICLIVKYLCCSFLISNHKNIKKYKSTAIFSREILFCIFVFILQVFFLNFFDMIKNFYGVPDHLGMRICLYIYTRTLLNHNAF